MIQLTRMDGREIHVNGDAILSVEHTPDTLLTLNTGSHLMVREGVDEVISRWMAFRRRVAGPPAPPLRVVQED